MIDVKNTCSISSFLNFGYDVTYKPSLSFDYNAIEKLLEVPDYRNSKDLFLGCIERAISNYNGEIVVPMSGGLDSRALLAGLLEVCDAQRIRTYTFGSKNSYDFEIGVSVSKKLGIQCKSYELSQFDFSESSLRKTAEMFDRQTCLFYHPPYHHINDDFQGSLFLIGFMGDPLAGSHLPKITATNSEDVFRAFCSKNQMVKSCNLIDLEPSMIEDIIDVPDCEQIPITKEEYCDFELRQLRYVYPHVMPKGLKCRSPFIDQVWFSHMLSIPDSYRLNQSYYNEFLLNSFPVAFSYPCKNNLGLKLNANRSLSYLWRGMHRFPFLKRKMTNYQDFNIRIRNDNQLYQLLNMLLTDLKGRKLNLNVDPVSLLGKQMQGYDYADAIINMASLEINLSCSSRQ